MLHRDCHGRNPLHLAAINGQVMVFNELIETSSCRLGEGGPGTDRSAFVCETQAVAGYGDHIAGYK